MKVQKKKARGQTARWPTIRGEGCRPTLSLPGPIHQVTLQHRTGLPGLHAAGLGSLGPCSSLQQLAELLQMHHLDESLVGAEQLEKMKSEERSTQIALKMQEEKQRTPKITHSDVFLTTAISRAVTSYFDDALGRSN